MGRRKPNKPRRPRPAALFSLRELRPPGEAYQDWYTVDPNIDASTALADRRLNAADRDILLRLIRLAPLYGGELPRAAIDLDRVIDTGTIGLISGDDEGTLLPLEEFTRNMGLQTTGTYTIRNSLHRLHALGALLIETHHDAPLLRAVARRPQQPGDCWILVDTGARLSG